MNKHAIKFLLGAGVMVFIGFGVLYVLPFFDLRNQAANELIKREEDIQRGYKDDTYGGSTPQETLDFFVQALKKNDLELASKYFAIEDQERWRKFLEDIKIKNGIKRLISEAEHLELTKIENGQAFFVLVNKENIVEVQVILAQAMNKRWKITDL